MNLLKNITLKCLTRVGLLSLVILLFAACSNGQVTPTSEILTATLLPAEATDTPIQPSPTPQPLAAQVNDQGITLAAYQSELARFQAAVGTELATEDEQRVLNDLIDQVLLAQAAAEADFVVDESLLQERYEQLVTRLGGEQALLDWMGTYGYSEESFRSDLARSIAAAWMRDQILADVPGSVEQVHAQQILLYNSEDASEVYAQLTAGGDFAILAAQYNPVTKGDLGWFPRGYLLDPKLDDIVFSLQPGEYSQVIETDIGYHIIKVLEREAMRPLSPDARLALQQLALRDWLDNRRSLSAIQITIP